MVSTDAAARGIDIPNVTHVIQADFAASAVDFLHRVGLQSCIQVLHEFHMIPVFNQICTSIVIVTQACHNGVAFCLILYSMRFKHKWLRLALMSGFGD